MKRGKSYEGVPPSVTLSAGVRRRALVIGNSAYRNAPLKNPRNDAELVAAKLRTVCPAFDVLVELDAGRDAMENALAAFEAQLAECDVALLFFAGHGLQVKGINYLIPVDADITQETHLRRRAISLSEILDIMGRVRTSTIVFLDACRDNPFARSLVASVPDNERSRSFQRPGLAEVRVPPGSLIAFATAPDDIARDGDGKNSPFTTALAAHITTPGISINDVMIDVCRDVFRATGNKQQPWVQSTLRQHFRFHELPATQSQSI